MTHPYATLAYARSLDHIGDALTVPEWRTAVIARPIDGTLRDACGPYPLTILAPDSDIAGGLEGLRRAGLVSVILVLDDFHRPALATLEQWFDVVRPFKTHYVVDRSAGMASSSKHHRRQIKKALANLQVRDFSLARYLPQWIALYDGLAARRGLQGVHAFSLHHHEAMSRLSGASAVGAFRDGELLSAHLWVEDDGFVHSHLVASSEAGFELGAAHAVNDFSIRLFSDARLINLGGGAGRSDDPADGLARFKRGFANAAARSYICGKILDRDQYERLSRSAGAVGSDFFPAYRTPRIEAPFAP